METDEELESGAGASTPPGDNLCNDYAQGLAEGFGALAEARGDRIDARRHGGARRRRVAVAVRQRGRDPPARSTNRPGRRWRRGCGPSTRGRPGGSFLVFSAWPTPDLRSLDFGRVGHPPLMFRPPGSGGGRADRRLRDPPRHRRGDRARLGGRPRARLPRTGAAAVRGRLLPPRTRAGRAALASLGRLPVGRGGRHGVGVRRRPPRRRRVHLDARVGSRSRHRPGADGRRDARRARRSRRCSSRATPDARSTSGSVTSRSCASRMWAGHR